MTVAEGQAWRSFVLGEFLRVKHGYAFKGEHFSDSGPYIVLTPGNFYDEGGFKHKENEKYYTGDFPSDFLLKRGDLLVVMTEQKVGLLGSPAIVPEADVYLHNQRLGLIVDLDADLAHRKFLYYLFNFRGVRDQIQATANGAKVRHTSPSRIYEVEVRLPSLEAQCMIASILSAYDDLIENNLRRIRILEEMAQALYREWFVKFRFPGHEKVRMVESSLGEVPEGWEIKRAPDAIDFRPRTTVPKGDLKPFVPMSSLADGSMLISNVETREGNSGSKFRNCDTLFARITPCLENGKTGFVQFLPAPESVALGSTEFIVLRSKSLCPELVYLMARSSEFRDNAIKSMTGASGRQRVQDGCFDKFIFAHPDKGTIAAFSGVAKPMFRRIQSLADANTNLRKTRDLLLPKLISGDLDVSDLDIPIPEEAA